MVAVEIVSQILSCILVPVPRGFADGMGREKEKEQDTHLKIQLEHGKEARYCRFISTVCALWVGNFQSLLVP